MVSIVNKELCCGCAVCADRCPKKCITMTADGEGFLYPGVDRDRCVDCGLCNNVCPIENPNEKKDGISAAFAVWNKDEDIRIQSTSGGVFSALADAVIQQGGIVIGAQYVQDHQVGHVVTEDKDFIVKLRQSKYVQSKTNGIYIAAKKAVATGRTVLFCGTPCHTEALIRFINGKPDNLVLCDFICRGVISPLVYQKYLEYLEKQYGAKVQAVHFKNKTFGWHRFSTKVTFENGKEYIQDRYHDSYMLLYLRENVSLRPSCYECRFKGISRCSDITLGDFWGAQEKYGDLDNDCGTSAVLIHTEKGNNLLFNSQDLLEIHKVDAIDIIKGNDCILYPPVCTTDRNKFFNDLTSKSFSFITRKYCGTYAEDLKNLLFKGVKHGNKSTKTGN